MNSLELENSLGILQKEIKLLDPEKHLESTPVSSDPAFDREQVHNACRNDMNFLAGVALPDVFEFLFPHLYLVIWSWLTTYANKTRDFSKLALGLPRGFAKTTVVKLFILYCILFTHRKFILIISHTVDHGINIISDVMDMLGEPNIVKIFGDYSLGSERDTQNLKIFAFRGRRVILAAIGAEGSIRGLNLGNDRPDVEIFEDFQSKEESESEYLADKLFKRMLGTIMKAKSPKGCLYLYVANMYPTPGSILRKLKNNPFWTKFIVGGILSDGTSLWEELQPVQQLLEELQNDTASGSPEIFFAEVLNDETAGIKAGIDISAIPEVPFREKLDLPQGRFIIVDPAGSKHTNDLNAVGYFEVFDGKPVFQEVEQGHWSSLDLIKHALVIAITHHCALIIVESVGYQESLLFWFNHICQEHQLEGFYFEPITPDLKSKNARIKTMLRGLVATTTDGQRVEPEQYISRKIRPLFIQQIMAWNPMQEQNVDELLDLAAYARKAIEMYSDLMVTEFNIEAQRVGNAKVLPAYRTSPF